jgi:hypothetical protein
MLEITGWDLGNRPAGGIRELARVIWPLWNNFCIEYVRGRLAYLYALH